MIEPYYEDDVCTIYNGDCGEVMPQLNQVDLVATDPPYGMKFQSNRRIIKHKRIVNDGSLPIDLIKTAISKADAAAYVFCRWDNLVEMPKPKSVLAWVKNNWSAGDLKHEHGRQWEACCFYPKKQHEFICRAPDVIFADKTGNTLHPTEKPVSLLERIISANVGKVVLDPFAGSGTTLRAAVNCGRKAIGIEVDERYCEIAAKRMEQKILFAK